MARSRFRTLVPGIAGAACATVLAGGLASGAPAASASSHREAPLIAGDPQADNTDVYAFSSPDKPDTVTLLANWIPFEEPNGGPNFYPWATDAQYNIKIDNARRRQGGHRPTAGPSPTRTTADTDTSCTTTAPVTVAERPDLLFRQTYTLTEIKAGGQPQGPGRRRHRRALRRRQGLDARLRLAAPAGHRPRCRAAARRFAGQAADPFFLDLRVFDLLYGGNLKEAGHNTLAGYNVNTIALQVPKADLALNGNAGPQPGHRHLVHHRAPHHAARRARKDPDRRLGHAGLAPGQPAGERGRGAGRTEGRVQRPDPGQGPHHRPGGQRGHWTRRCPS